jgi:hypothetical protein
VLETLSVKFPHADLCALIVWIPILVKDSMKEALPSVSILGDSRFKHFYDHNQCVGRAIANSVGWVGRVAWDIYLFYEPNLVWNEDPPQPSYWMHQLTDEWVKDNKYRTGNDLSSELASSMEMLFP